ncbi:MAG: helicase-related protein [Gemmatimonadota bacterium]|nr:helicase-related protein [Gemmatimonadota bacterium]
MPALADVIACLARAAGADDGAAERLGEIALTPAQARAAALARTALERYGGALLANRPGSGKTFVALAVARDRGRPLVLAPAALRAMWHDAARRAGVPIAFHSFESLSRHSRPPPAAFLIVDEAHRAGRPSTRRYRCVAALAHHARVLLLTATPVRNRESERTDLLALFLGADAACADGETIARCVIRDGSGAFATPRVVRHPAVRIPAVRGIAAALRALPPPLALANGAAATGLVRMGLARAWSSSVAALHDALQRRLLRGAAILATLEAGRMPARADLRAWTLGDDAVQMAFALGPAATDAGALGESRLVIERHLEAVEVLHRRARAARADDTARRAAALNAILAGHPDRVVVAFTCFESTARALFRAMARQPAVVLLTSNGAESGAGPLPRHDVIGALGPAAAHLAAPAERRRMPIRLVIATDLLSEGVNLQRASVVVHLDQPWTPVAREQREGRAARMGSAHDAVDVYRVGEPPAVQKLTALESRHRDKARSAAAANHPAEAVARVRALIARWRAACPEPAVERHAVAAVLGTRDAFVAALVVDGIRRLAVGRRRSGAWVVTDDPVAVHASMAEARPAAAAPPGAREVRHAGTALLRWARRRAARHAAGLTRMSVGAERRLLHDAQRSLAAAPPAERAAAAVQAERVRSLLAAGRVVRAAPAHATCEIEALLFVRDSRPGHGAGSGPT